MNSMKSYLPKLLWIGLVVLVVFSALGGAIADRVFVIRPLDQFFPRNMISPLSKGAGDQSQILNQETVVENIADQASKSVVTITTTIQQQQIQTFFLDPFGAFALPNQNIQRPPKDQDIGSGFVVDGTGLIVTNKHVVSDTNAKYKIVTADEKEYDVQKIYRDPVNDLAILKVDQQLQPLTLGDSTNLKVGQFVVAIGTALGQFRHTVTTGVISGLGRGIQAGDASGSFAERLDNVIQTDAAINPGNSGGPLLNSSGQVIGINAAVAASAQNIGFAIPINVLKDTLNTFNSTGQFDRPFFGVRYRLLPRETALLNDVPEGAYVVEVIAGSSATDAGILPGDILTKFDGKLVKDQTSGLANLVSNKKIGDTVDVELWRNKETKIISVQLKAAL